MDLEGSGVELQAPRSKGLCKPLCIVICAELLLNEADRKGSTAVLERPRCIIQGSRPEDNAGLEEAGPEAHSQRHRRALLQATMHRT